MEYWVCAWMFEWIFWVSLVGQWVNMSMACEGMIVKMCLQCTCMWVSGVEWITHILLYNLFIFNIIKYLSLSHYVLCNDSIKTTHCISVCGCFEKNTCSNAVDSMFFTFTEYTNAENKWCARVQMC